MTDAPDLPARARGTVVLLHGVGRSRLAMLPLAWTLRRAGFAVENRGYAGLRKPVAETAARMADELDAIRAAATPGPLHLVTHSLGGILARAWLARGAPSGTRLVQLAPPNQGAALADRVRPFALARTLYGAALDDLGIRDGSAGWSPPRLPDEVEVGVLAGGTGGRGYGPWLPEDNDGVVQVRETWLPEARDWALVPRLHTFIMNTGDTHRNVVEFLATGRFRPDAVRLARDPDGRARRL